jgi:hypothetical protein
MSFRTLCFSANDYVRRIRHRLIDIGGHDYGLHYLLWSRAARWKSMTCRRIHLRQGYGWTGRRVGVSLDAARCRSALLGAARCRSVPLDAARCRSMPLDAARCRSMLLDAARCRSMPLDAARCRSMPLDAARYIAGSSSQNVAVDAPA